jgi:hypothetical protein
MLQLHFIIYHLGIGWAFLCFALLIILTYRNDKPVSKKRKFKYPRSRTTTTRYY